MTHRIETNDRDGWPVAFIHVPPVAGYEQAEANAHLITAAPELYEALEAAAGALALTAEWLENDMGLSGTADGVRKDECKARAALASARGESNE
jgi:hypothetical protein